MHMNHRRSLPRSRRSRKGWSKGWSWYKRQWNRRARRHDKRYAERMEDEKRTCRFVRRQKTRIIYW